MYSFALAAHDTVSTVYRNQNAHRWFVCARLHNSHFTLVFYVKVVVFGIEYCATALQLLQVRLDLARWCHSQLASPPALSVTLEYEFCKFLNTAATSLPQVRNRYLVSIRLVGGLGQTSCRFDKNDARFVCFYHISLRVYADEKLLQSTPWQRLEIIDDGAPHATAHLNRVERFAASVPVGELAHDQVVLLATFGCTIGAVVWILAALVPPNKAKLN